MLKHTGMRMYRVVQAFDAMEADQMDLQVNQVVLVSDKNKQSSWWKGTVGTSRGYFPAECVTLVGADSDRGKTIAGNLLVMGCLKLRC